jgi:hypothetical protein
MSVERPQIATFALRRLQSRREPRPEAARPPGHGRGLMVLLAALMGALLAVGLAAFLVFGSQTGTASLAAERFCGVLVAHDYATAYADLSQALQKEGTEEQFAVSQETLDRLRGPATACTFSGARVQGSRATFTLQVTRQGTGRSSGTLTLVFERGDWKVSDYDASAI